MWQIKSSLFLLICACVARLTLTWQAPIRGPGLIGADAEESGWMVPLEKHQRGRLFPPPLPAWHAQSDATKCYWVVLIEPSHAAEFA